VPDMGACDECGAPHENGSQIDHCAVCGNCWTHCACTPQRTPADNQSDVAREGFVVPE
jgi:hypothetical protein